MPADFLRGCGPSEWEIAAARLHDPGLTPIEIADHQQQVFNLRSDNAIQAKPLFISYSSADGAFVDALTALFDKEGVRHWRDTKDMKAGRIETQIDRGIMSIAGVVLVVLSQNSVESDWVEWEASRARGREKRTGVDVLCPIALHDAWKTCRWSGPLRHQLRAFNILDFSNWRDPAALDRVTDKLRSGLALYYR